MLSSKCGSSTNASRVRECVFYSEPLLLKVSEKVTTHVLPSRLSSLLTCVPTTFSSANLCILGGSVLSVLIVLLVFCSLAYGTEKKEHPHFKDPGMMLYVSANIYQRFNKMFKKKIDFNLFFFIKRS